MLAACLCPRGHIVAAGCGFLLFYDRMTGRYDRRLNWLLHGATRQKAVTSCPTAIEQHACASAAQCGGQSTASPAAASICVCLPLAHRQSMITSGLSIISSFAFQQTIRTKNTNGHTQHTAHACTQTQHSHPSSVQKTKARQYDYKQARGHGRVSRVCSALTCTHPIMHTCMYTH